MGPSGSTRFDGWPLEAAALLADIAADNRADRWPELRERHAALVRGPTLALAAALAMEFGAVRVFRAHTTRRFRPDAPPLRTDTGGVATSAGGCGLGFVLSVDALTVAVGHWRFDREQRSRYRAAVDGEESGEELGGLLGRLAADGWAADPEGELQVLPRGWRADHPRIGLARRRGLQVVRRWELGPWVATPEPLERVRGAWRAAAPLVVWLDTHVGPAAPRPPRPRARPTPAVPDDPTPSPAGEANGPVEASHPAEPGGSIGVSSAAEPDDPVGASPTADPAGSVGAEARAQGGSAAAVSKPSAAVGG